MWEFIQCNNNIISIAIGIIGLVISFFGVYYGKKAYEAANKIFKEGIELDKGKVLEQISLEFVSVFFIPFHDFIRATKNMWESESYETILVEHFLGTINDHRIYINFPYYDLHKGELWSALSGCETVDQAEAFNTISKFVEKAKFFADAIGKLDEAMNKYIEENSSKSYGKRVTVEDFLAASSESVKEMFRERNEMVKAIRVYESKLTNFLNIKDMESKLQGKELGDVKEE